MSKINQKLILEAAGELFAHHGIVDFSIRRVAQHLKVAPSLIYYYFKNEDELLLSMFHFLNQQLGQKRGLLPKPKSAKKMLKQRIEFQLDNLNTIVAVLKYYFKFRTTFPKLKGGFLPDKSALHIEEVLKYGKETGEFKVRHIKDDAKVITHAINGFLLEFYPYQPNLNEKNKLVKTIYNYLIRAL